jgi:shikimate kinase/3-dehydroquinate synthase
MFVFVSPGGGREKARNRATYGRATATLGAVPPRRPIFLNGMMGTGKSALGRTVAEIARVPFVDLDRAIEQRAGMSVARMFRERGEASFRSLEHDTLCDQLADPTPRVIALGGGSLVDRGVRLAALAKGIVITLAASPAELVRRLSGDQDRPMLAGNGGALQPRLLTILEARAAGYAEAHAVIDTTSRGLDELAKEVLDVAELEPIAVPLGERTYGVDIVPNAAELHLRRRLEHLAPSRIVLVTDEVVDPLVASKLAARLGAHGDPIKIVLSPGERYKTLASVERILRAAVEAPVDRQAVVIGVGGGVVTDIAGLAAALALRGLRWIAVPTTVLSMVDASVGGKTAVDLGSAKNAVGAFHQPSRVIVDPSFSRSESARALRSGLAEVVKTALIGDATFYRQLVAPGTAERLVNDRDPSATAQAIRSSITVKAAIVGRDEREAGERAHLNLGHTIGHALEAEGGFERLTHGEAVSLGLIAALRAGVALSVTDRDLAAEVEQLLARLGLPTDLDAEPLASAMRWVAYDKKRQAGTLRMVLVRAPGAVEIARVSAADLPELLAKR